MSRLIRKAEKKKAWLDSQIQTIGTKRVLPQLSKNWMMTGSPKRVYDSPKPGAKIRFSCSSPRLWLATRYWVIKRVALSTLRECARKLQNGRSKRRQREKENETKVDWKDGVFEENSKGKKL